MQSTRLIILKFGGSVLCGESDLWNVVHEIYRWRREGWRVVAVVSALAGRTDSLLNDAKRGATDPCPYALAAYIAGGELDCAAKLGLSLDRAGVAASVLHPAAIEMRADGLPIDAALSSVSIAALHRTLDRGDVVVVPGFVAVDDDGRIVLLGRGGSDLTALFLAGVLQADRCRLIKDVDGLYEYDPQEPTASTGPRRFALATFDDALATDGSIVQHKAVRFAKDRGIEFELGCLNSECPSRIGHPITRLEESAGERAPLRIALLGLGTVGGGVYEHLRRFPRQFDVASVAVRDIQKRRDVEVPREFLTNDAVGAANSSSVDLVIELIGGTTVLREAVRSALERGVSVVTANKARCWRFTGRNFETWPARTDVNYTIPRLWAEALPILEQISNNSANPPVRVRAVLNGTTNFILNRLTSETCLSNVISEAQNLGLAEQDPSRDLLGLDAADKIVLLAHALGFTRCTVDDVDRDPIDHDVVRRIQRLAGTGRILRHVASLTRTGLRVELEVRLAALDQSDPLFDIPGERNAAVIERTDGSAEVVRGRGAGRWPTAEAVMADVLAVARDVAAQRRRLGSQAAAVGPTRNGPIMVTIPT